MQKISTKETPFNLAFKIAVIMLELGVPSPHVESFSKQDNPKWHGA